MGKIVIVDDDKEIADLIELYLKNDGYDTAVFYNSLEAYSYLSEKEPELLVLDVMMPGMDGFTMVKKIREEKYFPIIIVSAKNEDRDLVEGLMLGSDDYLKKPFHPMELVMRVKSLLRRKEIYAKKLNDSKTAIYYKDLVLDTEAKNCKLGDEEILLTPTEFEILAMLLKNQGKKLSSEYIFKEITGDDYFDRAMNSVTTHISNLRLKLKDSFENPKYIKTAWGKGYYIEKE